MSISRLFAIRGAVGKTGAIVCALIALVLVDSLVSRFSGKFNVIHIVTGQTEVLTGVLPEGAEQREDLTFVCREPGIRMDFEEVFTGFWLGYPMWRGVLSASPASGPGEYSIFVESVSRRLAPNPALTFEVRVYPDSRTMRKSHGPLVSRYLGFSAWNAMWLLFPTLVGVILFNYLLSNRMARAMARMGMAEIFMARHVPEGFHIAFSLGTRHGVMVGQTVDILDSEEKWIGEAFIRETGPEDSIAQTQSAVDIRKTAVVRLRFPNPEEDP